MCKAKSRSRNPKKRTSIFTTYITVSRSPILWNEMSKRQQQNLKALACRCLKLGGIGHGDFISHDLDFREQWYSMQVSKIPKLVLQSTYGRRKCTTCSINFQTWVIAFSSLVKVLQDHSGICIYTLYVTALSDSQGRQSGLRTTSVPLRDLFLRKK